MISAHEALRFTMPRKIQPTVRVDVEIGPYLAYLFFNPPLIFPVFPQKGRGFSRVGVYYLRDWGPLWFLAVRAHDPGPAQATYRRLALKEIRAAFGDDSVLCREDSRFQ